MEATVLQFAPTRTALIRHRLKVEAVLVYLGLPVRVREGCLFIDGQAGEMPVSIVGLLDLLSRPPHRKRSERGRASGSEGWRKSER